MAANYGSFQRIHNLPKRLVSISNTLLPSNPSSFSERNTALTVPLLAGGRNERPYKYLYHQKQKNGRRIGGLIIIKAKKDGESSNWGDRTPPPFANGSPGSTDCPVPFDQQPVNEYQSLASSDFFSWANEDIWKYGLRLGGIGTAFTVFIGWPVSRVSVDPEHELLKCGIGALCGGLLVVTLAALRLYLGWAYVGNRLLSATVEYEETGWYDGEGGPARSFESNYSRGLCSDQASAQGPLHGALWTLACAWSRVNRLGFLLVATTLCIFAFGVISCRVWFWNISYALWLESPRGSRMRRLAVY